MTHRGSGSGGPNPQVFVLITGLVALLGIPVGLTLAGWDPLAPTAGAGAVSNAALVPAAAPTPAVVELPTVTVRELPGRPSTVDRPKADRIPTPTTPSPVLSAPTRRVAAAVPPVTAKPHPKVRRVAKAVTVPRRRLERRHPTTELAAPKVLAKRPAAVERRTYAYSAPAVARPDRSEPRERPLREYASREVAVTREKPSRERPKRDRSRHREASRPKEPEAFGTGNSGFHYGASYDPYSMHVGR